MAQLQQELSERHDRDAAGLKVGSLTFALSPNCCSKTASCVAAHYTQCRLVGIIRGEAALAARSVRRKPVTQGLLQAVYEKLRQSRSTPHLLTDKGCLQLWTVAAAGGA